MAGKKRLSFSSSSSATTSRPLRGRRNLELGEAQGVQQVQVQPVVEHEHVQAQAGVEEQVEQVQVVVEQQQVGTQESLFADQQQEEQPSNILLAII